MSNCAPLNGPPRCDVSWFPARKGRWAVKTGPDGSPDRAIRVELCREADVAPLMHFIGTQWSAGHVLSRDEPLLRWQFDPEVLRGRTTPGPTVLLAWLGGEIVGMLGLTGFDLNVAGQRFPAMWLSHWFAAPAYRAYNVALRLIWAVRDFGVEAIGTLGANEASTKLLTRVGLEVIPRLPRWVGVFDVDAAADFLCAANPAISLEDAKQVCRDHAVGLRGSAAPEDGFRIVDWGAASGAAWDRFWSERLSPRLVSATRDAAYIQWRYVAHPRFEYQVRVAQRGADGAAEGLAVFRVEQVRDRATRVLRIVEFLASAEGEGSLARSVLAAARDSGAAVGDFYCSSAQAARALARVGFKLQDADGLGAAFPTRLQPVQTAYFPMTTLIRLPQAWRGTLQQLAKDGRLYVTKSDGDQDRPN